MKGPLLPFLISSAAFALGGANNEAVLRELGPDKKVGVCAYGLLGADATKNKRVFWLGLVGSLINSRREDSPYSQELTQAVRDIFEGALRDTGAFELVPSDRLTGMKQGKPLSVSEAASENGLYACVQAESYLVAGFGWKKKVKLVTKWQLIGSAGWNVKIETDPASEESQGVMIDLADPGLKPVFLQLARESAQQFLQKLSGMMGAAGSTVKLRIADTDVPPAGTIVDPGTLPQPEPGCALNADKKWEKRVEIAPGVELALVYAPPGSFVMGSAPEADDEDSRPQHQVTIARALWIGKYEVTQAQWKAVMGKSPSGFKGDDLPVDNVSWDEATAFVAAINQRLGLAQESGVRLPTEAEWEYLCRAGTTSNYSFSDSKKNLAKYAWFEESANKTTHPVGQLLPNPWGAYDIYGNVSEWCADVWHDSYQGAAGDGTAWSGSDEDRSHRGGHWDRSAENMRSYSRDRNEAKKGDKTIGLRVVMPVPGLPTALPSPTPSPAELATPPAASGDAAASLTPASTPVASNVRPPEAGPPVPAAPIATPTGPTRSNGTSPNEAPGT